MLKKINLESDGYKAFRKGIGMFSGAGAGWTLECMSIPWVQAVFSKNKLIRLMCYSGIVPMAVLVDLLAEGTTETIVDSFVDIYNTAVDKINGADEVADDEPESEQVKVEEVRKYMDIVIPKKNATPEEEVKFVDDVILKTKLFEFDSRESAQNFVEEIVACLVGLDAIVTVRDALIIKGYYVPDEVACICDMYGWDFGDRRTFGIEQTGENTWFVDGIKFHNLKDQYVLATEDVINLNTLKKEN